MVQLCRKSAVRSLTMSRKATCKRPDPFAQASNLLRDLSDALAAIGQISGEIAATRPTGRWSLATRPPDGGRKWFRYWR